jgi:hypothetical protein
MINQKRVQEVRDTREKIAIILETAGWKIVESKVRKTWQHITIKPKDLQKSEHWKLVASQIETIAMFTVYTRVDTFGDNLSADIHLCGV